jgi:glycosyltransferase involved in cell wall biosynthesis
MSREILVNGRFLSRRVTGVERHGREILSLMGDEYRLERTQANGWRGHLWEQFHLPRQVKQNSILWSPANTGPLVVANQALTLHDLSPLEHPGWFQKSFATWYRLFLPILIRRARVVFTPSMYVKDKICRRFGIDNIVVTPNGVDRFKFHPVAKQEKYDLPKKYVLFVGTLEPRKNLVGLLQAWKEVQDEFKEVWLIIAGTYGHVFGSLRLSAEVERVRFLGYVEEAQLPGLYAGATVFILPSFDEGFGLPALEAMACGVPVIASDGGALPEVVGDAGIIFKLNNIAGIQAALRGCLANDQLQNSLKNKGQERAECFSWQKTTDIVWNSLHAI